VPARKNNKKRKANPRNSVNRLSPRSSKLKLRNSSRNISNKLKRRNNSNNISSKLKLRNNSNNNISNSKPAGGNNSRTALQNNSSIPTGSNSRLTNSNLAVRTLRSAHSKPWSLNALSRLFA